MADQQRPAPEAPPPERGSDPVAALVDHPDDVAPGQFGLTPSLRLLLSLAAVAVVPVFMRSAATIINPLLLAVVVTMAVSPLLHALKRAVSLGLLTLLLVLFMLGEATTVSLRFASTPPRVSRSLARLEDFTRDMRRFVQATTITGLIEGAAVTVFLLVLGVHYAPLWGLLAFFMAFIPTLGALLAMAPPAFLALLELGWVQAIAVVLGILLIYTVIGNFVGRRLVAHHTNLSPLVVVLSVVLWGWVLGLLGGLLAVPMTLLVRRLFIEVYDESGWTTALLGRPHRERGPTS
jgi:predicted PurR-regulated permease PerM